MVDRRRSSRPSTWLRHVAPRGRTRSAAGCARARARCPPRVEVVGEVAGADGAPHHDALGEVGDAGPVGDLRDDAHRRAPRPAGRRRRRCRRGRCRVGGDRHQHEEVLVAGRRDRRVRRRSACRRRATPGRGCAAWRRRSRSKFVAPVRVKNRVWCVELRAARPRTPSIHQHGARARHAPVPPALGVGAARPRRGARSRCGAGRPPRRRRRPSA